MGVTQNQLARRSDHLGSSDMATLFGLNPFQTQYDLWLEKTDRLDKGLPDKPWLEAGNDFEPIVLKKAARELGVLRKNQYRSLKGEGIPLASHVDAIALDYDGAPVEAKTNGLFWPTQEQWGEPGTDEIPDRVMIQCQVHLACTKASLCFVPALFWGLRFSMYQVEADLTIREMIFKRAISWWQKHVIEDVAPEGEVSLEKVRLVRREPEKSVPVSTDVVKLWRDCAAAASAAEKAKENALAEVLKALGDAEAGICSIGVVTYKLQHRAAYSVEEKDFRVARFKKSE